MECRRKYKTVLFWTFGLLLIGVFVAITGMAMLTRHWQNSILQHEYAKRIQNIESPLYRHNRGHVSAYDSND